MEFQSFDESYLDRLRAGDVRTQEHFVAYFGDLMHIKLRSRLHSHHAIEDIKQDTYVRVLKAVRDGTIRQPDRLGPYVCTTCNNVERELTQRPNLNDPIETEDEPNFPAPFVDPILQISNAEKAKKIDAVLKTLSKRDRRILCLVFYDERDKDEICREFDITRSNLRVLLHRALRKFKSSYLKNSGDMAQ